MALLGDPERPERFVGTRHAAHDPGGAGEVAVTVSLPVLRDVILVVGQRVARLFRGFVHFDFVDEVRLRSRLHRVGHAKEDRLVGVFRHHGVETVGVIFEPHEPARLRVPHESVHDEAVGPAIGLVEVARQSLLKARGFAFAVRVGECLVTVFDEHGPGLLTPVVRFVPHGHDWPFFHQRQRSRIGRSARPGEFLRQVFLELTQGVDARVLRKEGPRRVHLFRRKRCRFDGDVLFLGHDCQKARLEEGRVVDATRAATTRRCRRKA